MISLGDQVLTRPDDEVRRRHERYAAAAGHLTMIVSSTTRPAPAGGALSPHLAAYAVGGPKALFPLRALWTALRHARRPVDLITTQDPFATGLVGLILARLLRAPLLVQNHASFIDNPVWIGEKPLQYRLFNRLGRWITRRADMNRVVNEMERQKVLALGVPPEKVRVIQLANIAPFTGPVAPDQVAARRAAWGLGDSNRVLLWVGRPVRIKRLPLLIRALARVATEEPDARLVLVGDMAAADDDLPAEAEACSVTPGVLLPGQIPFADLPAVYQMADVYVHASAMEGTCRAILEAGVSGLPVVAFDVPDVHALITDGENGFIAPDGDLETFAARVLTLLRDPALASKMGERGREMFIARYDPDRLFDAWMACWRDTAARSQRVPDR